MVKTRRGRKTHCYLRVVESYRLNGRVRQRVLWNMGRWERVEPGLTSLLKSLNKFTGEQFIALKEIKNKQVRECGNILLLRRLWEDFGFRGAIESSLGKKVDCVMVMVFHKLCQSTVSPSRWLKRVYLPEGERLLKLGQARLKRKLLNSVESLGRVDWPRGQRDKNGSVEVGILSPRTDRYKNYMMALPLNIDSPAYCKAHTRKELLGLFRGVKGGKKIIVTRYSTLKRDGMALLEKGRIPHLVFLKKIRTKKKHLRDEYSTFEYANHEIYLRTNVSKYVTTGKAKRAFKALLEAEAALGPLSLPSMVPPTKNYLKGYALVTVLAYLLNRILKRELTRRGMRLQPEEALDSLKETMVVSNLIAGRRRDYLIGVTREGRALLKGFGIKRLKLQD